ncbi:MAG: DUF4907 domain-containing protein [Bacteroidia bacterium]|nr:DUF4907 domain-containing protein [Bacteroidia bacterium]MBP7715556.1 DUF4907 domain-containing protein [Bacteroidia bacterium]MBP8668936.1 DUF4907 domain-containing protein [Bacteroidia bacterium]QQR95782.1 MAG: DUF4907 domain-containing protein [Bacteroidota bacterium]
MKYIITFILLCIIFSCNPKQDSQQPMDGKKVQPAPLINNVTVQTYANDSTLGGYGYDILVDGKIMVHQPNIPAVMGNRGFATEDDASKTATLVSFKLKNNIMPPSVTLEELDSIGIK